MRGAIIMSGIGVLHQVDLAGDQLQLGVAIAGAGRLVRVTQPVRSSASSSGASSPT
jgi:hypothetical protein